jgi:hypothetical protein
MVSGVHRKSANAARVSFPSAVGYAGWLLTAAGTVALPRAARADGLEGLDILMGVAEVGVPDVRFEVAGKRGDVNLSWPVHGLIFDSYSRGRGEGWFRPWATVFFEPQWVPRIGQGRLAAGTRLGVPLLGKDALLSVIELGAVAEPKAVGSITGIGLGLAFEATKPGAALVFMYRYVSFIDEPRHDISIDLLMFAF